MNRKKKATSFIRTEGRYQYTYNGHIAGSFAKWAAYKRSKEAAAFFFDFLNVITEGERQTVMIKKMPEETPNAAGHS